MNILYIGPYRQADTLGYESLNFLLNLSETGHTIHSRAIWYSNSSAKHKPEIIRILKKLEDCTDNIKYDLLIQHGRINDLTYTSKIAKHIYWPVLDKIIPDQCMIDKYQILQRYGSFLSSNKFNQFVLDYAKITNRLCITDTIHLGLKNQNITTFKLGVYQRYKKYYTLVDHSDEKEIKQLIVSFIREFNRQDNVLMICMYNISQDILDMYNAFIKKTYSSLKINHSINKILIVPIDNTLTSILSAHNTGDIFINLHDNISINYNLAIAFDKPIIVNESDKLIVWDSQDLHHNGIIKSSKDMDLNASYLISNYQNNILEIFNYAT